MIRCNIVVFPGSNCDRDAFEAVRRFGMEPVFIWHKDALLQDPDLVIVPGGFSYGDYLRAGAIAKHSRIMNEVRRFAEKGGPVLGICNGFQVLTESGLLPGALMMNASLQFICRHQHIRVETLDTPFTKVMTKGEALDIPIAHKEGNYFIDADGLKQLQDEDRVVFRYCGANGVVGAETNPNGSLDDIAGICSRNRNVVGLMPHPERAAEDCLPSNDGEKFFRSVLETLA
jgi:phosphoribosylformylglycinamidine synthase subunit PurQ / glutaminase